VERDCGANAIASGFEGWIRYGVNEGLFWPFSFAPPGLDGAAVEGTGGETDAEAFGPTVGPFATGGIPVTAGDGGGWVASGLIAPCIQGGNWEDWQPPSNNITANSHATA